MEVIELGRTARASDRPHRPAVALVLAALLAAVAVAAALVVVQSAHAATRVETDTVVSVYDGDTLTLSNGERVRLLQIDTPELGSGECYSRAARTDFCSSSRWPAGSCSKPTRGSTGSTATGGSCAISDTTESTSTSSSSVAARRRPISTEATRSLRRRTHSGCDERKGGKARALEGMSGDGAGPVPRRRDRPERPGRDRAAAQTTTPSTGGSTSGCDPSYQGACLNPSASDYDCAGGSGNGPYYTGPVRVVGPDHFRLDANGDGHGCE